MEVVERARNRRKVRSLRYGIAAITVCVGLAVAPVYGVAWAESTESGSTSSASADTGPSDNGPSNRANPNKAVDSHEDKKAKKPPTDSGAKDQDETQTTRPRGADPDRDAGVRDKKADTPPTDSGAKDQDETQTTRPRGADPDRAAEISDTEADGGTGIGYRFQE
jgi:hypothetical protein